MDIRQCKVKLRGTKMNLDDLSKLGDLATRLETEANEAQKVIDELKHICKTYQEFLTEQIKQLREEKL